MDLNEDYLNSGLTSAEVEANRKNFGINKFTDSTNRFIQLIKNLASEPMLLILIACAGIYFVLGEAKEGMIMITAIAIISSISFFQERKSNKAIKALREITSPHVEVLREGTNKTIQVEDLVKGDIVIIEEGKFVPADMKLIEANDISIDESMLTGESFPVRKTLKEGENNIFKGSYLLAGQGKALVEEVGDATRLGKLGKNIQEIHKDKSPLQKQVSQFVKYMTVFGLIALLFMWIRNYLENGDILKSLLSGLTIAMSVFPEEIPVAMTIFMALGAWEMVRKKVLIKDPQTLETLGSATVICVDKTGTLTENKMKIGAIYAFNKKDLNDLETPLSDEEKEVLEYAMWASEPIPFDPMEKAIHKCYLEFSGNNERPDLEFIHEYPLAGTPPAMTHIYAGNENKSKIIACKGGPETIFSFSKISPEEKKLLEEKIKKIALKGMRILAVAKGKSVVDSYPQDQKNFDWQLLGLIAFKDPLKKNIPDTVKNFYRAGVEIKMITGDIPETASAIAKQAGIKNYGYILTGQNILSMNDKQLDDELKKCHVFARMLPEAKLRAITRLIENGEIVCMTGDGINDAPSLKASNIGIAMGKKGTEIAKESSSIILMNDDLSQMVTAISAGRKIYSNLKKAILYIISIHIPIIGIMIIPLLLRWKYESIFSPVHIIFFELLMGPICSIAYEKEPMEENLMNKKPRKLHKNLFSFKELSGSILQGIIILLGLLVVLEFSISISYTEKTARAMVFVTIMTANIFLALSDRSRKNSMAKTIRIPNNTLFILLFASIVCLLLIVKVDFLTALFEMESLSAMQTLICISTSFISVFWFEIAKALNKREAF